MKQKKYLFQAFILVVYTLFVFPQQEAPIEISPFIGTTLDRVERDYFKVLPAIEGFQEAEFYMNKDGSLKAIIKISRNGVESDTILEQYSSQRRLELLIVNNILKNISDDKNKVVSIKLKESKTETKEQRIFTIYDSTMFTVNQSRLEEKVTNPRYGMFLGTRLPKIEKVIIPGQSTSDYILPSILVGAGVGFITGIAIVGSKFGGTNSENELENASRGAVAFGIIILAPLIGAGIGLLVSPIVGVIFGEDDQPIDPNTTSGLAELEPYIAFPEKNQQKE